MQPDPRPDIEIVTASNGALSARAGEVWLDDPDDPDAGARTFAASASVATREAIVLLGHGLGYRVGALLARGARRLYVYEPDPAFTEWVRSEIPGALDGATVVHTPEALELLLATVEEGHALEASLFAHNGYTRAYPWAHARATAAIRSGRGKANSRLLTLRERIPPIVERATRNIGRLHGAVVAPAMGRFLEGQAAIVVSAGPSLDRNVDRLREAAQRALIVTNSTALPALQARGVPVDVLVVIDPACRAPESLAGVRMLAIDIGVDPGLHAAPLPRAVFAQAGMIGALGDELALSYGSSVATGCVALVEAWGARDVILVGQDCAYTDGRYYASGLGRDDYRVRAEDPCVVFEWPERARALFRAHNGTELVDRVPRVDVRDWAGDGTIWTSPDLLLFRDWFVDHARIANGTRRWNATEGGVHLDGWTSAPLADVLRGLSDRRTDPVAVARACPPVDVDALLARRDAARTRLEAGIAACRTLLAPPPDASREALASAQEQLRAAVRAVGAWEVHARGAILTRPVGADPRADARVVLEALASSGERLLSCFLPEA